MPIDFSAVRQSHVLDACAEIAKEGVPPKRRARSTLLDYKGKNLPA